MTTVEKLFVQIFERKNWIIEQVKQQTELYNQQLASKLLIDGISPPSWLWNPKFHSDSSDPKELKKEELISELLFPHLRSAVPYSGGHCSVYNQPAVTVDNGELSDGLFMEAEAHASNKGVDAGDGPTTLPECHDIGVGCALNCVPELDLGVASPQEQREVRTSNIYTAPDQSLARIQRSKSRQKALELRNSAKVVAKSCLRHENKTGVSSSGFTPTGFPSQKPECNNEFVELAKLSDINSDCCEVREAKGNFLSNGKGTNIYSGRITRSRSSSIGLTTSRTSQTPDHVDEYLELAKPDAISSDSFVVREAKGDCPSKEQGTNSYEGRITRSRSFCKQASCVNESFKLDSSCDISKKDGGKKTRSQTTCRIEGISKHVNLSNIVGQRVTQSRSGASKRSLNRLEGYDFQNVSASQVITYCPDTHNIVNHEGNAKTVAGAELVSDGPVEAQADCSRSSLDGANQRAGLEVLGSRPPTVLSMSVKPKQLDYDDIEEYSFSETFSPMLEAKRMDKSAGKRCCAILESAASPSELTASNPDGKSSEKQSLVEQKVSNESGEALRGSFEDHVEECVEVESDGNVNSMLKSVEDNLEAALSIQHSHETVVLPNVDNGSGVEMNQNMKSLLSKGFESSPELRVQEGELGCDGRSETTLFTFKHEQLGPSIVSSLTKQATGDSQGCLVEEVGMADPTSIVVDSQNVLHLENKLDWGSALNMACSAKTTWERKSQLGEDGLSAYGSVGSPYSEDKNVSCMKLRELQFAKNSSPPERRLGPATQDSWPQFKRRKIESQQTNFFSASPSFRVQKLQSTESNPENRYLNSVEDNAEDVLKFQYFPVSHEGDVKQSNVYKSPDVEIYQKGKCLLADGIGSSIKLQLEEDELGSEWRNKSTQPPSTFIHRQLGPSHVLSLSKEITGDSQVFLDEELITDDPISVVLDVKRGCNEQDCQGLLWSENNIDPGTTDDLTCTEKTLHERKSHLGKDDLYSYCLSGSPHKKHLDLIGADQTMPAFEGFILDVQRENGQHHIAGDGISFDKLDLANATIERASVLEQLCKSVSMHTPLSHFSATFKSHRTPDLHESLPNGLLESMDPRSTLSLNGDGGRQIRASNSCVNEVNCVFEGVSDSDCLPYSNTRFGWSSEKPYTSPVGKLWERITSNSSSSEKQRSLNPEFTCFPIEEDPSFSEENENTDEVADTIQEDSGSILMNSGAKREPLAEIAETCSNPPASVSAVKIFPDRGSLDSVNAEVSFTGTHNRVKQKLGNRYSNKRRCTDKAKENQTLSMGPNGIKKAPKSLNNRFSKPKLSGKTSLRKGGQSLSEREPRRNNIVSNITSFVPLVQQKQAATVCTGKRDIKVKALETAEAAKRLEEKREKERKMKKEALKLKRDRMEQEKMRQMELNNKKKEEERKKKDANMAMRKRLREEGERKDNERKIKRIEEARRQQREQGEKLHAGKVEKEVQCGATDERVNSGKGSNDELGKHQRMEKEKGDDNFAKNPETEVTEPRTAGISTSDVRQASIVLKDCEAGDTGKAMIVLDKSPENDNLVTNTNREKSYEISPYQCSDDEEEEEDDIPTRKFVPSWASKNCVVLVLSSQQKVDPDVIFPPGSFCSMDEVLLPRKLQLK